MSTNPDGWRTFVARWYGEGRLAFHDANGTAESRPWRGGTLHQDVYDRPEASAPVVVLLHGIQGYGRMFLSVTEGLWRRGCAVVAPDIPGYGLSASRKNRGRRAVADQLDGVEAAVRAAAARWPDRPLVLAGASLGAPLAFATALKVPEVRALTLWTLFSPDDPAVLAATGRFGRFSGATLGVMRPVGRVIPGLPMAAWFILALEHLNAAPGFVRSLKDDPLVAKTTNLRAMLSLQRDLPPLLRWEAWDRPILVMQPGNDRMIPPAATCRAFTRLTAEPRRLEMLDGVEHFPAEPEPLDRAAALMAGFLEEVGIKG
ncbi:Lysophospholipase [Caenispirillum salinarum AK4]|uniref:Lysophospholipase n=1 Tax=Caenispirillum salinarum AK4 TaxID=1238182 RepID=K9GNC7_9PROT|nr:alpha/beta fold hydrolase [Caenispirillum salinarum]EKV26144.1 Lysophospholipase [Caenispirillum salinarum AK4]